MRVEKKPRKRVAVKMSTVVDPWAKSRGSKILNNNGGYLIYKFYMLQTSALVRQWRRFISSHHLHLSSGLLSSLSQILKRYKGGWIRRNLLICNIHLLARRCYKSKLSLQKMFLEYILQNYFKRGDRKKGVDSLCSKNIKCIHHGDMSRLIDS